MSSTAPDASDDVPSIVEEAAVELARNRGTLLIATLLGIIAFTMFAFLSVRYYRATTVLVAVSADRGLEGAANALGQLSGLASLAGIGPDSHDTAVEEALAIIRSRQFLGAFIHDRGLGEMLQSSAFGLRSLMFWRPPRPPTVAKAVRRFNSQVLSVTRDRKTSLITVNIDWTDPQEAALWANELIERLNTEMRTRAITTATANLVYLEKERDSTITLGTKESINKLIESQLKERMIATVSREYAFRAVDRAVPPEVDDPVRPNRALLILAGPFVGFSAGSGFILLRGRIRRFFARIRNAPAQKARAF